MLALDPAFHQDRLSVTGRRLNGLQGPQLCKGHAALLCVLHITMQAAILARMLASLNGTSLGERNDYV